MSAWEAMGQSDEWYTPRYIFDALGCRFDLDVAHPAGQQTHVPCVRFISRESLAVEWSGFIWMNPPFGGRNGLTPWLSKFVGHSNGIALVPDRTSAPWFQAVAPCAEAILFLSPKVKFERPDGSVGKSPSTGTALLAIGGRGVSALRLANARGLGFLTHQTPAAIPPAAGCAPSASLGTPPASSAPRECALAGFLSEA